jgi:hypothetical protein
MRAQNILNLLPPPWPFKCKSEVLRAFQRGTVSLPISIGYKVIGRQSLKMGNGSHQAIFRPG